MQAEEKQQMYSLLHFGAKSHGSKSVGIFLCRICRVEAKRKERLKM
jgi:hypothetical protein